MSYVPREDTDHDCSKLNCDRAQHQRELYAALASRPRDRHDQRRGREARRVAQGSRQAR